MRRSREGRVGLALALAVGLLLLVGGPWGNLAPGPAPSGRVMVGGDSGRTPLPAGSTPLDPGTPVAITVALEPRDPVGLAGFLANVESPASPEYRHYLTFPEFRTHFGPTSGSVRDVMAFLNAHGARHVHATPDGLGVSATMGAADVAAAFGVELLASGADARGSPLFTASGAPSVPARLGGIVAGVDGLTDAPAASPEIHLAAVEPPARLPAAPGVGEFVNDGSDGTPWYFGSDWAQAYGLPALFPTSPGVANATFPTGEAVATLLMSGYNATFNDDLPPFDPAVVAAYFNDTFPAGWPMPTVAGVPVTVNGVTPPAPGGFGSQNDSTLDESENSLDLEMAGSLAPGSQLVNFYFAASLFESPNANPSIGTVADYFAQTLGAALAHDYAPQRLAAVTGSFGLPDLNDSLWNSELLEAAAMGVTVLAASGDQANAPNDVSGRFQGPWPTWPASAGFETSGALSVGGADVALSGNATGSWQNGELLNATYDPRITGIAGQGAWYNTLGGFGNVSGTEGGVSPVYGEPAWQLRSAAQPAIVNATVAQGAASLGRAGPDLALAANNTVAYVAEDASGIFFEPLQGTSIAAPLAAGVMASAAAVAGHPFGFVGPELYRIASYFAAHPGATDPFLDITGGGNYVFAAAPGWDPTTGWGGLSAPLLLAADADPAIAGYQYTGPTPGLPPPPPPPVATPLSINVLIIVGLAVAVAIAAVIVLVRPRPGQPVPPPPTPGPMPPYPPGAGPAPPWPPGAAVAPPPPGGGSYAPWPPGAYPSPPPAGSFFHCPYCGTVRPAEPVRCPGCGAY